MEFGVRDTESEIHTLKVEVDGMKEAKNNNNKSNTKFIIKS